MIPGSQTHPHITQGDNIALQDQQTTQLGGRSDGHVGSNRQTAGARLMAWFKVDDALPTSKGVLRIKRRVRTSAMGLWVLAGAWSAKHMTDGFIPEYVIEELASTPAIAEHLVSSGLWITAEDGWKFADWEDYQPTREQILERRHKEVERKREYRRSRRDTSGTSTGQTVGHLRESASPDPTRPVPTRPVPIKDSSAEEFEMFWQAYPRKVGKQAAVKAFAKARKSTELNVILEGLTGLRRSVQGKDQQFTPHASSWLNGERWLDEAPQPQQQAIPSLYAHFNQ